MRKLKAHQSVRQLGVCLLSLLTVALMVGCASSPVKPVSAELTGAEQPLPLEVVWPLSKQGGLQYSLLLHKELGKKNSVQSLSRFSKSKNGEELVIQVGTKEGELAKDSSQYELVHVYGAGVYPDFEPNGSNQPSDTMFQDDTFAEILAIQGVRDRVAYQTSFDEEKFLTIVNGVVNWLESQVPLKLEVVADKHHSTEFVEIDLVLHGNESRRNGVFSFYLDDALIDAQLQARKAHTRIKALFGYKIGVPTGTHRIKAVFTSSAGETATAWQGVVNTYGAKPTLHLVAIGINEFPLLGPSASLNGAVNDANLLKKVFRENGASLFDGRVDVSPYSLGPEQTTRQNIRNLIEKVKKNVRPNDYFVFFFSSHGAVYKDKYYAVPSDYQHIRSGGELRPTNGISEDEIAQYLISLPTIFRMAILDTCYAGKEVEAIKKVLEGQSLGEATGVSVLTAAKSTQAARDNYKGYGLFTYVLGAGLSGGADYNGDNIVDSIEIAQYLKINVGLVSRSSSSFAQDAVVLPDPSKHFTKRFELTQVKPKTGYVHKPSVFTPREAELYINAITQQDSSLMTGLIQNNNRLNQAAGPAQLTSPVSSSQIVSLLSASPSVDIKIEFENDSTEIGFGELEKLEALAVALNAPQLKSNRIFIEGHADDVGDKQYNLGLSQQRASQVLEILASRFEVDRKRMSALGYGELYPIATNLTETGRAQNRRVSIFIYRGL